MTILDADYFFRVDIPEMLFWAKDHDEEKCPQLTLFTTHFNNVSQWSVATCTSILMSFSRSIIKSIIVDFLKVHLQLSNEEKH